MNYLLYIDSAPPGGRYRDYFLKFDYKFIHQMNPHLLSMVDEKPAAILIHTALVDSPLLLDKLHKQFLCPIIAMSDIANESECIETLESGADDFILKSIHPRELHARIGAITRRMQSIMPSPQDKIVLCFDNWRLYPHARRILDDNDNELMLSSGEYDLLYAFISQPQVILSREYLMQVSKQMDFNPLDRRIDVQISRLRQKIEPETNRPQTIKTIRNSGYVFTADVKIIKAKA